jgi:hypothetical protein
VTSSLPVEVSRHIYDFLADEKGFHLWMWPGVKSQKEKGGGWGTQMMIRVVEHPFLDSALGKWRIKIIDGLDTSAHPFICDAEDICDKLRHIWRHS